MGSDVPSCGADDSSEAAKANDLLSKAGWELTPASNTCANTDSVNAPDKLNFRQMVLSDWEQTRKALDDPNTALAMIPGEGFVLATGAKLINFGRLVQTLRRTVGLVNTAERSMENEAASEAPPPVTGARVPQSLDLQEPFDLTTGPFKGARITRVGQDEEGAVFIENKGGLFGEGSEIRATQKTDGKLVYEYDKPADVQGIEGVMRKTVSPSARTTTYESDQGLDGNENLIRLTRGESEAEILEYKTPEPHDWMQVKTTEVTPQRNGVTYVYRNAEGLDGPGTVTSRTVEVNGDEATGTLTYDPPIPKGPLTVAREVRSPEQTVYENPKGLFEDLPEIVRFTRAEDSIRIYDYRSPQEIAPGIRITRLTINPSGNSILHNPAGVVEGGPTEVYLGPEKSDVPELTNLKAPPGTSMH